MKLYYGPGACSLATHIVLEELGLSYEGIKVDLFKGETMTPEFLKLNPMGAVPTVVLDNGESLTEIAAIVQYFADLKPEAKLAPPAGSFARVRLQEMLNFISTEVHKGFAPLWGVHYYVSDKAAQEEFRKNVIQHLDGALKVLDAKAAGKTYLLGDQYTVADAYFFTIFNWCNFQKIPQTNWPNLKALFDRIAGRPAVGKAMELEGIL